MARMAPSISSSLHRGMRQPADAAAERPAGQRPGEQRMRAVGILRESAVRGRVRASLLFPSALVPRACPPERLVQTQGRALICAALLPPPSVSMHACAISVIPSLVAWHWHAMHENVARLFRLCARGQRPAVPVPVHAHKSLAGFAS